MMARLCHRSALRSPLRHCCSNCWVQRSDKDSATVSMMPASTASGSCATQGPITSATSKKHSAPVAAARQLRPPACSVAMARARSNTLGRPPHRPTARLHRPRRSSKASGWLRSPNCCSSARAPKTDSSDPISASTAAAVNTAAAWRVMKSAVLGASSRPARSASGRPCGTGPTCGPSATAGHSVCSKAYSARPRHRPISCAGHRCRRQATTQVTAAVARPSSSVPGWKPPAPRPVSSGHCASRISSATPFMKPASTGCGTYCPSRPRRSQAMPICSTPDSATASPAAASNGASVAAGSACHWASRASWATSAAKIRALAELGPQTGRPWRPSSTNSRPPMPAVMSAAVTPCGASAAPSGA